ncbi:SixA phosphatase family protein [Spirosoma fluminis]
MSIVLYIVRHAKAEDRAIFMADHDRELTPEGIMAAARIGHHLHQEGIKPDLLISSTAPRALDTAKVIAEQIGYAVDKISVNGALFDGGPKAYLAAVNAVPGTAKTAMIVGHNPDVSYFAEFLTHQSVGSMSKGAVVAVEFEDVSWGEVSGRTGRVGFQIAPIQLQQDL